MLKIIAKSFFMKKYKMLKGQQVGPTGLEDEPKGPAGLGDGKEVC